MFDASGSEYYLHYSQDTEAARIPWGPVIINMPLHNSTPAACNEGLDVSCVSECVVFPLGDMPVPLSQTRGTVSTWAHAGTV